jgi:hypothetical protein
MVMLLCAAVPGVILGLRFKVFVMLPVMLVAATGIIAIGVSIHQNFQTTALNLVLGGVILQIGYLAGCSLAEYRKRRSELRIAVWTGDRAPIDEVIYRSEPNSGGERDQWVLVSDPQSGERGVRHDRVTRDADGSTTPFVHSGPIVPLADFLGTEQPQNVKHRLLSLLAQVSKHKSFT